MTHDIELVRNGQPVFCLEIRPSQDAEAIIDSIGEFLTHFEKCVGQGVIWFLRGADDLPPNRLVLNFSPKRELEREEFEITAEGNKIELIASTVLGIQHAVSYFLEQAFGVRWLWPAESGTVTPGITNASWPSGTRRIKPDWLWRQVWLGGAFYQEDDPTLAEFKVAGISHATHKKLKLWQSRNRLGGLNIADGHRWAQICSPLVFDKSHPEYFALVNGKRDIQYYDGKHNNQPCTSNPEVIKLTADYLIAQFNARPELDGFSFAVNDGHGFCECENCLAIDEWAGAGVHEADELDKVTADDIPFASKGASLTDRMLKFANDVAERVDKVHPDKLLLILIYSLYRTPPKRVKLHEKVIAQFCTASWAHAKESIHEHDIKTLRGVAEFTGRQGIYDYFINGANGTFPRGIARVAHANQQDFYDCGCRYFATQAGLDFAVNGFAYYMTARHLWDLSLSFDAILDDYCTSGFGAGAESIKRYLCAFIDKWEQSDGGAHVKTNAVEALATELYEPEWLAQRRKDLQQAADLAAGDKASIARIGFLMEGMDYTELFCQAAAIAYGFVKAGAPFRGEEGWEERLAEWAKTECDPEQLSKLLDAKARMLEWIQAHHDGFWISVMWLRYRINGGLLGNWLKMIVDARAHSCR